MNNYKNIILELTYDCNFRCAHCYQPTDEPKTTLSFDQVKKIEERLRPLNISSFLLTGGEPLSNPSFPEIYEYLHTKGYGVAVNTNGSYIDESIVDLFTKYPPSGLGLSVYGNNEACYSAVTGQTGMFDKVMASVNLLQANGIDFKVKYLAMNNNYSPDTTDDFLTNLGSPYEINWQVMPRRNGDIHTQKFLIKEKEQINRVMSMQTFAKGAGKAKPGHCTIAESSFTISPAGDVRPCVPYYEHFGNILRDDLNTVVDNLTHAREQHYVYPTACEGCETKTACVCPIVITKYPQIDEVCAMTSQKSSFFEMNRACLDDVCTAWGGYFAERLPDVKEGNVKKVETVNVFVR